MVDKIYSISNVIIVHLAAASTTNFESIPSPAQPGPKSPLTLQNHFLLEASAPTSTTMETSGKNYARYAHINTALGHEVTRDRSSLHQFSLQLAQLIQELKTNYPLPPPNSTPIKSQLSTTLRLDNITPYNIGDVSNKDIGAIVNQNRHTLGLKTLNDFSTHDEYISYLKSYQRELYLKVQKQSEVIDRLHQKAVQLQQSWGLYRGQ